MLNDRQVRKTFELLEISLERMNESSPIYIPCPYQEKHTKPTRARDCQLYFNDGPNIFCFHESCREALRELCDFVRFEVTGSCRGEYEFHVYFGPEPNNELAEQIKQMRETLIKKFRGKLSPAPVKISSIKLLSQLFKPKDVLWIGQEFQSGSKYAHHFRMLEEWVRKPPPPNWDFTTGATFWPGSCDRNNESVAQRRYLILESDRKDNAGNPVSQEEQWAMIAWACTELHLKLKAILFSGNKSYHAWVLWPGEDWFREHRPVLEAMGFDPKTISKSQPVRLGGAIHLRTRKRQEVLWLRK
jgi:hypothetical protein